GIVAQDQRTLDRRTPELVRCREADRSWAHVHPERRLPWVEPCVAPGTEALRQVDGPWANRVRVDRVARAARPRQGEGRVLRHEHHRIDLETQHAPSRGYAGIHRLGEAASGPDRAVVEP